MTRTMKTALFGAVSAAAMTLALAAPAQAIPFRDDVGDQGAQDFAAPWDGVIQIFMWNRTTGGISFNCSGSLINPRTVISAAHCFNSRPSSVYGVNGDFTPIIAFGPDTFVPLFNWIGTGDQFVDDRNGLSFGLNVMMPDAAEFGNQPFPTADVAMISLLDPLYTLPTYGMLFSPIPEDILSEGVHVNMIGYGSFHPGSDNSVSSINGRRRAGENMLGFLGSFNHFFAALAQDADNPSSAPSQNQMLYWIDFDQPDRTDTCERTDAFGFSNSIVCSDWDGSSGVVIDADTLILPGPSFDIFPGDALPNEVGTAGGDSGGPLMAMNLADVPLILGVLSGGFVEGFLHAAGQDFGSVSYYNPLFAYRNFITENNPYKYVSALAGDGAWEDPDHWVQDLDPNAFCYVDGVLDNCLPEGEELGFGEGDPWGVVFDTDINDLLSGAGPAGAASAEDATDHAGSGLVAVSDQDVRAAAGGQSADNAVNFAASGPAFAFSDQDVRSAGETAPAGVSMEIGRDILPASSGGGAASGGLAPANTGPGATGFVPDNFMGAPGAAPRFYDVTLSADGTTTLSSAVDIDRLSVAGQGARLDITADGSLFSLIGTEVFAGNLNVDGGLISRELVLWGGGLTGSGAITLFEPNLLFGNGEFVAGGLYNVAGVLNPGVSDDAGAGALNLFGDYVQTSAGIFLADWTADAASRLIVSNSISLNGMIAADFAPGVLPQYGDRRRVIEFGDVRMGEFSAVMNLPGVLFLNPIYGAGYVDLEILAENFTDFATFQTPAQFTLAQRLDQRRDSQAGGAGPLSGLYDIIDLLPAGPLVGAFENLVPHESFQLRRTIALHGDVFANALRQRLVHAPSGAGGAGGGQAQSMFTLLASADGSGLSGEALSSMARQSQGGDSTSRRVGRDTEIFFHAGLVDGSARTSLGSGRGDIEGGYAIAGIGRSAAQGFSYGAALGIASSENDQILPGGGAANTRTETFQLTGYAGFRHNSWIAQLTGSYADHDARARRSASLGGPTFSTTGSLGARTWEGTALVGYQLGREALTLTPTASVTASRTRLSGETLVGSPLTAMTLQRESYNRHVARAGLDFAYGIEKRGVTFEPRAHIGYAVLLNDGGETLAADFASAPGASPMVFNTGVKQDANWIDINAGLAAIMGNGAEFTVGYQTRGGSDLSLKSNIFSAGFTLRF